MYNVYIILIILLLFMPVSCAVKPLLSGPFLFYSDLDLDFYPGTSVVQTVQINYVICYLLQSIIRLSNTPTIKIVGGT